MTKVCVVAAGGTGGHMFPAEALAREAFRLAAAKLPIETVFVTRLIGG